MHFLSKAFKEFIDVTIVALRRHDCMAILPLFRRGISKGLVTRGMRYPISFKPYFGASDNIIGRKPPAELLEAITYPEDRHI